MIFPTFLEKQFFRCGNFVLFAFYAIPNIFRIRQFGGGNYVLVFFGPKYKNLISCFMRVNNAK